MAERYDLVGDVHGMRRTLDALLDRLGYGARDGRRVPPRGRVLVSVGDLLDRGPDPLGCLETVAAMAADGDARMVLGNHELNAVHFLEGIRTPAPRHARQVATTRAQRDADPARWERAFAFLRTVPTRLQLDGGNLRVVHACWDDAQVRALPEVLATRADWERAADPGDPSYAAIEHCLKGPEEEGEPFRDADGHERRRRRVAWWRHYPADAPPVVFGHYAFPRGAMPDTSPDEPTLLGPGRNAVGIDFSVATGGPLVAFRYPEREFVVVGNADVG